MNWDRTEDIIYIPIGIDDLEEVVPVAIDAFVLGEAPMKGLRATPDEFRPMMRAGIKEWLRDGLSLGARDEATGKLVGVIIATRVTRENDTKFWSTLKPSNSKASAYIEFEKVMENAVNIFDRFPRAEVALEQTLLCVLPEFRRRNIARILVQRAEKLGIKNKCSIAVVEASGLGTQHIFSKLGYETYFELQYGDFKLDNKNVFDLSLMDGTVKNAIMIKTLLDR